MTTPEHDDSIQTNVGREKHHVGRWVAGIVLIIAVGFADAAFIIVPAKQINSGQLFAGAVAFVLIAFGIIYTVWRMERSS